MRSTALRRLGCAASIGLLIGTILSSKAEAFDPDTSRWVLLLGGGVLIAPEYSGSDDYEVTGIPLIAGEYRFNSQSQLYIYGQDAGVKLSPTDTIDIGVNAHYRFDRDSSDDPILVGLRDIDDTIEVGPFIRFNLNRMWSFGVTTGFDVLDEHGGTNVTLDLKYFARISEPLFVGFNAFASWGSDNFMDAYYSVPVAAPAIGRPVYDADSSFYEVGVNANALYFFTPRWFARGEVGVSLLTGDAADSPIVQDEVQFKAIAGIGYRFGGPDR